MKNDDEEFYKRDVNYRLLLRLAKYFRPYKRYLTISLTAILLSTLSNLLGPDLIRRAIETISGNEDSYDLWIISLIYLLNLLAGWGLLVALVSFTFKLGFTVLSDIRSDVFRHVQELSMNFFDKTKAGRIIARAESDVDSMEHLLTWGIGHVVTAVVTITGAFAFLMYYNMKLSLILMGLLPVIFLISISYRYLGLDAYRMIRASLSKITAHFAENISGVRVVQAYTREKKNQEDFDAVIDSHMSLVLRANRIWFSFHPVIHLMSGFGGLLIFFFGYNMVMDKTLDLGEMTAFFLYLAMFFGPIMMLTELYNQVLMALTSAERVFGLLDTKPDIVDAPGAKDLEKIEGEIEFRDVFFRYPERVGDEEAKENGDEKLADAQVASAESFSMIRDDGWILHDISFKVKPGQTIALVGPTGAGKSSVINLVARFYEAQRGEVLIDGNNINNVTMHSLHSEMGIVLQDNFLFTGTVMDNIRYGHPDATDEDIIECARKLHSYPAIERLAKGFQTEVKERGEGLSGGERQLICFTRAMLADPKILVLDEATSAVDTQTESMIQDALERLFEERTTFVVAHRLSTIRKADLVMVVKKGEILERGTHTELLELKGDYAKLFDAYLKGTE